MAKTLVVVLCYYAKYILKVTNYTVGQEAVHKYTQSHALQLLFPQSLSFGTIS